MNKTISKKNLIVLLLITITSVPIIAQTTNPSDILNAISTETSSAATILKTIFATIAWIFLGLGIVMIIYSAIVDSQRMKFGIISFLAAALILAVGYGVGLF